MSAHRRTRRARPVVGRVALAGVALAGLSAAPGAVASSASSVASPVPLETSQASTFASSPTTADHDDVLWYGLLSAAALAGAAGAHQLVGRPRRA